MNAKFEKWCDDEGLVGRSKSHAKAGYRYAIQSLEVTDELVSAAERVYFPALQAHANSEKAMHYALAAVLSALKEQAK